MTQQPQPPQTSREYCNLDNSSLALFLSLWIDNFVFDVYCSISCWSCLLGNHLIRFVTSHLVFARSASCSRSWKQVWCAGTGLISFTPWRKHAPGLNTYMAKIYLASFRNQFRHIDSLLYVSERGLTIHETAGLSFHVLFCSETAGLSFHVLFCSESDLTLVSRQHSCSHLNVIITAVAARYQRE